MSGHPGGADLKRDYSAAVAANLRLVMWMRKRKMAIPRIADLVQEFPDERIEWIFE